MVHEINGIDGYDLAMQEILGVLEQENYDATQDKIVIAVRNVGEELDIQCTPQGSAIVDVAAFVNETPAVVAGWLSVE